ncbi:VOC family protein [Streptomyces sp. NBC_01142]|uniref:VOC family protein n=1 Tax=Streptomyces sp. NBC_01142 TaxID=2975865 RepID=UPI0022538DDA|nr:VOC family protein [Streptomyces sp. NBC_01142]MCX4819862.1 VOC family protein [Streptomyces sp. NBC_01142]
MTEATRHTPGTPCWVSLMVHGLDATQDFYGALFGWEFSPGPQQLGPYVRALLDGKEVAGIGRLPADRHLPIAWTPYMATNDADVTAEAIRSACGTVAVGPLDAGEAGRLLVGSDPAGAVFGVWQPAAHRGTAVYGTHGTPAWNELLTRDTSSVGKFYEAVFGYELETAVSADFDHLTLCLEGRPVAALRGVGNALPRDRGSHWMTSFEVEDTDEAARRVVALGGHVLQTPRESSRGRLATVADPEGAVFTIVRSAAR